MSSFIAPDSTMLFVHLPFSSRLRHHHLILNPAVPLKL